jgi:outer membrane protein assembly factor BamA
MTDFTARYLLIGLLLALGTPERIPAGERPVVRRVRIAGADLLPESRVRAWLGTRSGTAFDSLQVMRDVKRILAGYREAGYWQVAVSPPGVRRSERGASVVFRVEEGAPTRIASMEISGNLGVATDVLASTMQSRPGMALVERKLEQDLEAILGVYEERGYPFCALRPEVAIRPGDDGARVAVVVDEGPFVRIDTVLFTGNRTTRPEVLAREMRLEPGEPYDQRRVDRALDALRRLPYLLEVGEPELEGTASTDRMALRVPVREAPLGQVTGGIGFVPGTGGAGGKITGAFALDFANLMGSGRRCHAAWSRRASGISDLDLSYREPWMLGVPLSAEAALAMRQRLGNTETRVGLDLSASVTPSLALRIGLMRGGARPDSSGLGLLSSSRFWGLEGGLDYDTRSDRWNPRSGVLYAGRIGWQRTAQGEARGRRGRVEMDLDQYLPAGRRSVLALGLHGALVQERPSVSPEARLRLGGVTTIRGHREEAFLATSAAWINAEWRRLFGRQSRAFAFLDFGVVVDPDRDGRRRVFYPVGYGIGMRADSRLGLVGLDYGLAKGDSPGQGKVHVRMVNRF